MSTVKVMLLILKESHETNGAIAKQLLYNKQVKLTVIYNL